MINLMLERLNAINSLESGELAHPKSSNLPGRAKAFREVEPDWPALEAWASEL
jgi:hypothetical protein